MIKVLLVDDHPSMLAGMRALLEVADDVEVVGEATESTEAVRLAMELEPDVMVLDLRLKGGTSGIEACREIKALPNPPCVLVHSAHNAAQDIAQVGLAGADGYLHKSVESMELSEAVKQVCARERVWEVEVGQEETESRLAEDAEWTDLAVQAEEALRESEERFRITFDTTTAGMAYVAPDGRWMRVNDKLCRIVGYAREELLGLTFQDITYPDDLDADLEQVERMLAGRIHCYSTEKRYLRKDRTVVWVNLTVTLVRDSSGEPRCFISVIEDITAHKLAELVPEPLTPRELEVLRLAALGRTNREISQSLMYSMGTIKLHVQRIIAKLGVENRAQAATCAVEIGLIPPLR